MYSVEQWNSYETKFEGREYRFPELIEVLYNYLPQNSFEIPDYLIKNIANENSVDISYVKGLLMLSLLREAKKVNNLGR